MIERLGDLANPDKFQGPLDISGLETEDLIHQLRKMVVIRKSEEKIGEMIVAGAIQCPCHLAIGQEAVATAVASCLRKTDRVFGAHRSHSHFLAINENVDTLFAEVLGKFDGCSHGMGGSMHIIDSANGFFGSVPIVGATIPIATGAGLAAKLDKKGDIAVSYFGDGACEEGSFHESLNFASAHNLPVLFVCENNLFSSHLHIDLRQPTDTVARFAAAHRIEHAVVDGNDVAGITKTLQEAVKHIRETSRPFFLEAITYRWRGHVGPSEDTDVGVKRTHDLVAWKRRDPIARLLNALKQAGHYSDAEFETMSKETDAKISSAWSKAEAASYPEKEFLLDVVYS